MQYTLSILLSIGLLWGIYYGITTYQTASMIQKLEELSIKDPNDLTNYINANMNPNLPNAGKKAETLKNWLDEKYKAASPIFDIHLYHAAMLSNFAEKAKKAGQKDEYNRLMTRATTIYLFAYATLIGDFMRCKDQTARAGTAAIHSAYFRHFKEFYKNEIDQAARERIVEYALDKESKIANRKGSHRACAHGISTFTGESGGFVTDEEWQKARISALESFEKSFKSDPKAAKPAARPK